MLPLSIVKGEIVVVEESAGGATMACAAQCAQNVKNWKKPHISRSKVAMNDHDPSLESILGKYLEKIEKILSL